MDGESPARPELRAVGDVRDVTATPASDERANPMPRVLGVATDPEATLDGGPRRGDTATLEPVDVLLQRAHPFC